MNNLDFSTKIPVRPQTEDKITNLEPTSMKVTELSIQVVENGYIVRQQKGFFMPVMVYESENVGIMFEDIAKALGVHSNIYPTEDLGV